MKTLSKLIQIVTLGLFLPVLAYAGFSGGGGGGGTTPIATTSSVGTVQPDGVTALITASGVLSTPIIPISGTFATNTIAYSPNGSNISPLSVGTNLSITSGVLNASASGSGTVTNVSSTNGNITVANSSTTPTLTLVQAPALQSATTTINVASASAPTAGQVLTAASSTAATWVTPSGSSMVYPGAGIANWCN